MNDMASLTPDVDEALGFFDSLLKGGGGRISLACIVPDVGLSGAVFSWPDDREKAGRWIDEKNRAGGNIHYVLNEPVVSEHIEGKNGKLKKADVEYIRGIVLDLDPDKTKDFKEDRERLLRMAGTFGADIAGHVHTVVDSGGGIQVVYLFDEKLPNTPENVAKVEAQTKAQQAAYGGDNTQSIEHLFRVPGTVNYPNKAKRKVDRSEAVACVLYRPGDTTSLASLACSYPPPPVKAENDVTTSDDWTSVDMDVGAVLGVANGEALPKHLQTIAEDMRETCKAVINMQAKGGKEEDRSARDFAIACDAINRDVVDPTECMSLMAYFSPEKTVEKNDKGLAADYLKRTYWGASKKWREFDSQFEPLPEAAVSNDDVHVRDGDVLAQEHSGKGICTIAGVVDVSQIPVREYLINPILPIRDAFQITGEPAVSKSTLALLLAVVVASEREDILRGEYEGRPINDTCRLHGGGNVLVYNCEDRLDEMKRRLRAIQNERGLSDADMKHSITLWSGVDSSPLKLMGRDGDRGPLKVISGTRRLEAEISRLQPALVILDTQISLSRGGNENSNDDQDAIAQHLANIAARHGISLGVVHHTAKATRNNAGDMAAGRGGFAAAGKFRVLLTLCNVTGEGDDEKTWGVTRHDRLVRLDCAKLSHSALSKQPIVFERASVLVGNGPQTMPDSTDDVFDAGSHGDLKKYGDAAPVLKVVSPKALIAAAKARKLCEGASVQIAYLIDELLGEDSTLLLNSCLDDLSKRMSENGLGSVNSPQALRKKLRNELDPDGVVIHRAGGSVRICIEKEGAGKTSPLVLVRKIEAGKSC